MDDVKELTGKDIQFIEKNDLSVYAHLKIARKNMQSHTMFYKPKHTEIINHLIAHECGHILRMYGTPEQDRIAPYVNDKIKLAGLREVEPEIQKLAKFIPFEKLAKIVNMWFAGTVRQVTNYPSDIMIEKWIYDEYPDLRSFQSQSLKKQYDEAVQGLSDRVEQVTPRKFLKCSNGMNYAFFKILSDHLNDGDLFKRYARSYYLDIGKDLIILQQDQENTYKGDVDIVNKWAEALGIANWFAWKDFEDIPDDYLTTFS